MRLIAKQRVPAKPIQHVTLNARLEECLGPSLLSNGVSWYLNSEVLCFRLEDYVPRNTGTEDFVGHPSHFLDMCLTDPPCRVISVQIDVTFEVSVPTDVSADGKVRYTVSTGSFSDDHNEEVECGPTIGDLITAASNLKGNSSSIERERTHHAVRWKLRRPPTLMKDRWSPPGGIPLEASMNERLDILRAVDGEHAVGIADRRTQVTLHIAGASIHRPQRLPADTLD